MADPATDTKGAAENTATSPSADPAPAAASTSNAAQDAPDPDEDDLDELDDMLDEFSTTHAAPAPTSSGPGRPTADAKSPSTTASAPTDPAADISPEDFAAQLQKEMAALMGQIDESPEMKAQMEAMMAELAHGEEGAATEANAGAGAAAGISAESAGAVGDKTKDKDKDRGEENFQETIRKTMERMKASGDQASAAASAGAGTEGDLLAQLMQELSTGEGGEGGEEDFSKMLLGMMEQLTNKEILYEPMKDLDRNFPEWLEKNEGKTGEEDLKRFREQRKLVGEIVGRFERDGYNDADAKDREFIVERMQQMQALGAPPNDLVGDMKETQDALGELDPGCAQQ